VGKEQIENEQIEHNQDQSRTETGRKKKKPTLPERNRDGHP
jgi:hypothetical protein